MAKRELCDMFVEVMWLNYKFIWSVIFLAFREIVEISFMIKVSATVSKYLFLGQSHIL